jgi:hypothetical protein
MTEAKPEPIRGTKGASILGPTTPRVRPRAGTDWRRPARTTARCRAEVVVRRLPQSVASGRMGAADDRVGAADRPGAKLRQHATQGRWGPGNALAQAG